MFEGTDSVFNNESVPSNMHFLQILQNLEFTMKFAVLVQCTQVNKMFV